MESKTFEDALVELEKLVKELESGEVPLEIAIDKYTEAMKLVKKASDILNNATEKVNKILAENGELKDFDTNNEEDNQ